MRGKLFILFILLSLKAFASGHILMYHRIGDGRHPTTNVSVESFIKQLDYLEEKGYEIVELSKIMGEIEAGREVSDRWVAITIDDAYKSFYENGVPVLRERDHPFTLFVNTQAVDRGYGDFMTWDMIRDASRYGEIGGHSHTHASLPNISMEEAKGEIEGSKELLEKNTGRKMRYFAYPYGEYSEEVKKIVEDSGYEGAFKQVMGAASHESDIYAVNRIPVGENTNLGFYLSMRYLPVQWKRAEIERNTLKWIEGEFPQGTKRVEVFLSGYGWEWKDIVDGRIEVGKEFKRKRNNLIIRDEGKRYNDYLILR